MTADECMRMMNQDVSTMLNCLTYIVMTGNEEDREGGSE